MKEKKISYYLDTDNGFLLAYEKSCEFFVKYDPTERSWEDCKISFFSFRHDYCFREITADEAASIAEGNLPTEELRAYLKLLKKNLGGKGQNGE